MVNRILDKVFGRMTPFKLQMVIKISISVVLLALAGVLFFMNKGTMYDNKQMLRLIKSQKKINDQLTRMMALEKSYDPLVLTLKEGDDPKKIQSDYMNKIKQQVERQGMKVDSFAPEEADVDGFHTFRYNIKFSGEFPKIMDFFVQIKKTHPYLYVKNFNMKKSGTAIAVGVYFELVGRKES